MELLDELRDVFPDVVVDDVDTLFSVVAWALILADFVEEVDLEDLTDLKDREDSERVTEDDEEGDCTWSGSFFFQQRKKNLKTWALLEKGLVRQQAHWDHSHAAAAGFICQWSSVPVSQFYVL